MTEADDLELVMLCRSGDRRALDQLVLKYQRPLFNVAYRMCHDRDEAADIVQNAFMKAFEKLHQYDAKQKFFSWIYRITINEAINATRQRRESLGEDLADLATPGPEESLLSADESESLRRALMSLDENYRSVLVLRHFSECSYLQLSEIMDLPEKTVKSRLYTARQLLLESLQKRA